MNEMRELKQGKYAVGTGFCVEAESFRGVGVILRPVLRATPMTELELEETGIPRNNPRYDTILIYIAGESLLATRHILIYECEIVPLTRAELDDQITIMILSGYKRNFSDNFIAEMLSLLHSTSGEVISLSS